MCSQLTLRELRDLVPSPLSYLRRLRRLGSQAFASAPTTVNHWQYLVLEHIDGLGLGAHYPHAFTGSLSIFLDGARIHNCILLLSYFCLFQYGKQIISTPTFKWCFEWRLKIYLRWLWMLHQLHLNVQHRDSIMGCNAFTGLLIVCALATLKKVANIWKLKRVTNRTDAFAI